MALTSSTDTFKAGRLNIESATGDTIFNLGGTNGSGGSEFSYVRSSKRTQIHDVDSNTTIILPQKSGELALTSDFISNIRRGAKVQSPDTNEWGPAECPSGCILTQVEHKSDTPYGVKCWYRPLQIFINGQWKTLAGDA
uniref:Phage tail protein n=1 Tax=Arsenophonus endosymbiont of Trialeurodes vaporariorum TaxID=235567 RepID=A0A3B0MPF6_9GAMM